MNRVLVSKTDIGWIAQSLDVDVVGEGSTIGQALDDLDRAVAVYCATQKERGFKVPRVPLIRWFRFWISNKRVEVRVEN